MNSDKNVKWLLTITMNLGFCRETFPVGSVITELEDSLLINGREYKDNRDMEILKRQMLKNPDKPWIIPYSKEDEKRLLETGHTDSVVRKRPPTDHRMPVITSDDDLAEEISMERQEVIVVPKNSDKKMEVVHDHEDIEERIRRLEGKGDAASVSERVMMKSAGIQKMPVVRDDSLGAQYDSSKNPALNAGTVFPMKKNKPLVKNSEPHVVKNDAVEERGLKELLEKILAAQFDKLNEKLHKFDNVLEMVGMLSETKDTLTILRKLMEELIAKLNDSVNSSHVSNEVGSEELGEISAEELAGGDFLDEVKGQVESSKKRGRGRPRKSQKQF